MEANVVDGSIEATDNTSTDTRTITNTSTPYDSYLVSNRYGNEVWKTWLGTYNSCIYYGKKYGLDYKKKIRFEYRYYKLKRMVYILRTPVL